MNHQDDDELRELLKRNIPPVGNREPSRNLWPQMLERLSRQPVQIPWFDWALAALVGAAVLIFPGIIPALFYHL